jgi:hypothetical protein
MGVLGSKKSVSPLSFIASIMSVTQITASGAEK